MLTSTANQKPLSRPHIYMLFYYAMPKLHSDVTSHFPHIPPSSVNANKKKEALRDESFLENSPLGLVSATMNSCSWQNLLLVLIWILWLNI